MLTTVASDLVGITRDSYNAPLDSEAAFFTLAANAYPHTVGDTELIGCSPNASGAQKN